MLLTGVIVIALLWFVLRSPSDPMANVSPEETDVNADISEGGIRALDKEHAESHLVHGRIYNWQAGLEPPEPVYRTDDSARILSPVERMVKAARTVERHPLAPDAEGRPGWLRLVHAPDFKYPWLRVEERFHAGSDGSLDLHPEILVSVADHVLVRFADSLDMAQEEVRIAELGGQILRHSLLPGLVLVALPEVSLTGVPEMIERLKDSEAVAYAEPDWVVGHLGGRIPNDPDYDRLWGMAVIDAPQAWEVTTGSREIVVAVIDTGVDYFHEDLAANIWTNPAETADGRDSDGNGYIDDLRGWNFSGNNNDPFDDNAHGTHVAGIIGAVGNNAIGMTGVAWEVSIMPLKFLNAQGSGVGSDAIDAIRYAVMNGAQITNNSWGGAPFSQALYDAIEEARDAGVAFIAAAGNSNGRTPVFPAAYGHLEDNPLSNVLSVGATHIVSGPSGPEERKASFSEWGAHVSAPGVSIFSTIPGSSYIAYSGTSMATPMVSGAAALMLSMNPHTETDDLLFWLVESADNVPTLSATVINGARLNAAHAVVSNTSDPIMVFHSQRFTDHVGPRAGNGIANPGETIELTVTVGARGPNPAHGISAILSTNDPDITLIEDSISLGNFGTWERREAETPFIFSVAEDAATPRVVLFDLILMDEEERTWQASLEIPLFTSFDVTGVARSMDGTPIPGATITVDGDHRMNVTTDEGGNFVVELTEGSYTMGVNAPGMQVPPIRRFQLPLADSQIDFVLGTAALESSFDAITVSVRPGQQKEIELMLTNNGSAPLDFELRRMDYAFEAFADALNTSDDSDFAWIELGDDGTFLDLFETWYPQEVRFADGSGAGFYNEAPYFMMSPISIGFPFPFYDQRFESLRVNNSGWMSFTGYNRSGSMLSGHPTELPDVARAENKIAFAWNHPSQVSRITPPDWTSWGDETMAQSARYSQVDDYTFVFNWNRWPSSIVPLPFRQYLSGQVVLKSDGTILIKYKSYEDPPGLEIGNEQPRTYVVGLQDGTNTRGSTVVFGLQYGQIRAGTVFRFRPQFGAPWLKADTRVGRISGFGGERRIVLTLDTTHLPPGEFSTSLIFDSNSGGESLEIPVQLMVDANAPASPGQTQPPEGLFSVYIEGDEFGSRPTVISENRAVIERHSVPAVAFHYDGFESWGPSDNDRTRKTITAKGTGLRISRQGFTSFPFSYNITENTVVEFDYQNAYDTFTAGRGTVHGIGFADSTDVEPGRIFQLLGDRRDWGSIVDFNTYASRITSSGRTPGWQRFRIPVGQYYTGSIDRIVFVQHARAAAGLELLDPDNIYRNIRIFEAEDPTELEYTWSLDGAQTETSSDRFTRVIKTSSEETIHVVAREGAHAASATRTVSVAGDSRFLLRINFQPENYLVPSGFLADIGLVYGDRGNGLQYGWNLDSRAQTRRDPWFSGSQNAQSDTLAFFGLSRKWEIAVPDGLYRVTVQSGSTAFAGNHLILVEDAVLLNASTTAGGFSNDPYVSASLVIPVTDGRLTLTSGRNATTINFVEIERISDLNFITPIADFTLSPQSGEAPLTVQFDSSASFDGDGKILAREWSFGNGFHALGASPIHTFSLPGRYEISLTVTDDDGLSNTVSRTVLVDGVAAPYVVVTPPTSDRTLSGDSEPLTYTIKLSDPPEANVTIELTSSPESIAVTPASLVFTAENFNLAQTVTISAPDMPIWPFGLSGHTIEHTTTSSDTAYDGVPVPNVTVIVQGADAPFNPRITLHPQSAAAFTGASISFAASAEANPEATWEWFYDGSVIPDATGPTLILDNLTPDDAGSYWARATNAVGSASTEPAQLLVRNAPSAQAIALTFPGYSGTETLEQFPVPVRLHENIPGFGYNTFLDSDGGSDLRFLAADLSTVLPHEIEIWNPNGVSIVWVRTPFLSPDGTAIIATWGNNSTDTRDTHEVWANNYRLVYQFADTGTFIRDSGPNGFHGTVVNSIGSVPVAGVVGDAYNLAGDYIDTGANAADLSVDGSLPRTFSFWLYHRGVEAGSAFQIGQPEGRGLWSLRPRGKNQVMNDRWAVDVHNNQHEFTHTTADTWVYFAAVYDGMEGRVYANGELIEASRVSTNLTTDQTGNLRIGNFGTSLLDGIIDSFRVASIVRSQDWIRAEYASSLADNNFTRYEILSNGLHWPVIVHQPQTQTVATGASVLFNVEAVALNGETFFYQWFHDDALLPHATSPVLELQQVTSASSGHYRARVTNENGDTWSDAAQLIVVDAPKIVHPPQSQKVTAGAVATFTVTATGGEPLRFQWYRNDEPIPGAALPQLAVPARLFQDAAYRVRVTNVVGEVLSTEAVLSIVSAPVILEEPRDASVVIGMPYAIFVEVEAVPEPAFQWYLNDQPLSGENASVLKLEGVLPSMAGEYAVVISNEEGTTTSRRVALTTRDLPSTAALRIAFPGYEGTTVLRDFPVLIRLNQQIPGFRYLQFADRTQGSDLRFLHSSIEGELDYEIDHWNDLGQTAVWVRVPELSPHGTEIIATWGDSENVRPLSERDSAEVWSNGYQLVYHMAGQASNVPDSSPHDRDGIVRNPSGARWVNGMVGRAHDFTADYVDMPHAGILGIIGARPRTVSLWAYTRRFNDAGLFHFGIFQDAAMWSLRTGPTANRWKLELEHNEHNRTFSFEGHNQWVHFTAVYDGSEARVYANGTLIEDSVVRVGLRTAPYNGRIASYQVQPQFNFDGIIDEFRVANVSRHSDWIRAEWATVGDHAAFTQLAPLVRHDAAPPVIVLEPRSTTVRPGNGATFSVIATSPPNTPATYQWHRDGQPIVGATNPTLSLPHTSFADAGDYSVVVSNTHGASQSATAALRVAVTAVPGEWAGMPVNNLGWADAGPFLGLVFPTDDWVYLLRANRWVYLPEAEVAAEGAWLFWPPAP